MFAQSYSLIAEKNRYYRVKSGQSAAEISSFSGCPVTGDMFGGRIIFLNASYRKHPVQPCESYKSIAEKYGVDEGELRAINSNRALYPMQTIFIPVSL